MYWADRKLRCCCAVAINPLFFDSAELLDSPKAIAAYVEAAFEGGDTALIAHALGAAARARGMTQIAHDAGMSRDAVYKALSRDGNLTLATLSKVMGALGLRLTAKAV
jgi:probable addiction module antidote protein